MTPGTYSLAVGVRRSWSSSASFPAVVPACWSSSRAQNPTGSMKDRMALARAQRCRASGKLGLGGLSSSTPAAVPDSLAFGCAPRWLWYPITLVTSDAFSREKRDHMRALGAKVIELPSQGGRRPGNSSGA